MNKMIRDFKVTYHNKLILNTAHVNSYTLCKTYIIAYAYWIVFNLIHNMITRVYMKLK